MRPSGSGFGAETSHVGAGRPWNVDGTSRDRDAGLEPLSVWGLGPQGMAVKGVGPLGTGMGSPTVGLGPPEDQDVGLGLPWDRGVRLGVPQDRDAGLGSQAVGLRPPGDQNVGLKTSRHWGTGVRLGPILWVWDGSSPGCGAATCQRGWTPLMLGWGPPIGAGNHHCGTGDSQGSGCRARTSHCGTEDTRAGGAGLWVPRVGVAGVTPACWCRRSHPCPHPGGIEPGGAWHRPCHPLAD